MPDALRPGVTLFDVPGRGTAVRDATGTLTGLDLPGERIAELRDWFAAPAVPAPAGLADELAAFAAAGHLGGRPQWPAGRSRVALLGDPALTALLAPALLAAGARPQPGVPGAAAVCAVHPAPAPASWCALDHLPGAGVAWQRVSVEGRHVLFEPVAAAPGDVRHADVRARRLAAAGSGHRHLAAYWETAPPVALDAADRALIVALAVADLRAWALDTGPGTGNLVPSALPPRRRLRVLDLDSGAIADHPVLPVPPSAM